MPVPGGRGFRGGCESGTTGAVSTRRGNTAGTSVRPAPCLKPLPERPSSAPSWAARSRKVERSAPPQDGGAVTLCSALHNSMAERRLSLGSGSAVPGSGRSGASRKGAWRPAAGEVTGATRAADGAAIPWLAGRQAGLGMGRDGRGSRCLGWGDVCLYAARAWQGALGQRLKRGVGIRLVLYGVGSWARWPLGSFLYSVSVILRSTLF